MSVNRRAVLAAGGTAAAAILASPVAAGADNLRRKGDSGRSTLGLVVLEEHCLPEEVRADFEHLRGRSYGAVGKALGDIYPGRLAEMDRYGIQMMVLSLTIGGPQDEGNPARGQDLARRANDALAKLVHRRPDRFSGFACLAMHDVDAACHELERAVRELGLRGVLLNNVQQNGSDRDSVLYYDEPQYDAFWATTARLGVPVYLHPNYGTPARERDIVPAAPWLRTSAWNYTVQTGLHAMRIITTGVFDRHPAAQLILGHNGERIVSDLWRIDHYRDITVTAAGYGAKRSVRSYFKSNVAITTSGQFSTPALRHCVEEIGADRVMFSVDTPYEKAEWGVPWFRSAEVDDDQFRAIGRENAIRLLKLPIS